MKATLGWLKEFIEIEMDASELAEKLTMAGVECYASEEGIIEDVVVGEIIKIKPHPNADRLSLCEVTTGNNKLSIVCGATNIEKGQKVPLALAGAVLPEGRRIESTEIQGEMSAGMLCSEKELDVGDDASGIWILPAEIPTGMRLDESIGLGDWVLDLDLTPNRSDCLSIIGLAHEISALIGNPVSPPEIELSESDPSIGDSFSVSILDPDLCPRYVAKCVQGIAIHPSPLWLRRRLQLIGQRPINNIVDVTNYVMWELGQPLHAFDLSLLERQKIVVKRAGQQATFVTLDGKVRALHKDMLLIWDGEKPVAIAGIMGGLNSEVYEETEDILLESAYFQPMSIRRTSKALGLFSEASRRFEKGVDPHASLWVAERASQLMCEISGGRLKRGAVDAYPVPIQRPKIDLRKERLNLYLGMPIDPDKIQRIFEGLDFDVIEKTEKTITVSPPARRLEDITREVDLIEEVARIVGYDQIPTALPKTRTVSAKQKKASRVEEVIRTFLVGCGYTEIITYSFISENSFDQLLLPKEDFRRKTIHLMNPIGEEQNILRTTMLPGLLSTAQWNIHHQSPNLRLFELGKIYLPRKKEELPEERPMLAALITGERFEDSWCTPKEGADFFDLKGSIENLIERLGIEDCEFVPSEDNPFYEKGRGGSIVRGSQVLGSLGELSKRVMENFDLEADCFAFEVALDRFFELAEVGRRFTEISKFPPVYRDLSVVLDRSVLSSEIVKGIRSMEIDWIRKIYVFDHYEGKQVSEEKQGLGFRICYQSMERNLTDREVNEQHERVIRKVTEDFDAKLR